MSDPELRKLCNDMRSSLIEMRTELDTLKREFSRYKQVIDDRIETTDERAKKDNHQQIVVMKKEIMGIVQAEIAPLVTRHKYMAIDGEELVSEFQKKVFNIYNPDSNQKRLEGVKGPQTKHEFQKNSFMFTEED